VSLRNVDEIKGIFDTSRTACKYLLGFLDDLQDIDSLYPRCQGHLGYLSKWLQLLKLES
jgi:hypothetical protein